MLGQEVTLSAAFIAGVLSFLTPCILPMVPVYIMYITGVTMEEDLQDRRMEALTRTIGFVLGFTLIFMLMGASASFIGQLFIRYKNIFSKLSGVLILIFGLSMMGLVDLKFLRPKDIKVKQGKKNWFSSILMGMAFAAGWTPCFGPILGSILIVAGKSTTAGRGIWLLFVYSLGMAIPFLLTALFINSFNRLLEKGEKVFAYLPKIAGLIMAVFGVLVFFDKVVNISRIFM